MRQRLALLALLSGFSTAGLHAQIEVDAYVVNAGGTTTVTAGQLEVTAAIGQPVIGTSMGEGFQLTAGLLDLGSPTSSILDTRIVPGLDRVRLSFTTNGAAHVLDYVIERATSPMGPFAPLVTLPGSTGNTYDHLDTTATSGTTYTYLVSENLGSNTVIPRLALTTRPYGAVLPPSMARVGPNGFGTIRDAIAAAPPGVPSWVVTVEPGTYPPFTIYGTDPPNLRIVADETGPVFIDTTSRSVRLENRVSATELAGLTIGTTTTDQHGLYIDQCPGPVIVDRCKVQSTPNFVGILVRRGSRAAVQRCTLSGSPGLLVDGASQAALSLTDTSGLIVEQTSSLSACENVNTGLLRIGPQSTYRPFTGVMPVVETATFTTLDTLYDFHVRTGPSELYQLMYSFDNLWFEIAPHQMPLLLGFTAFTPLVAGVTPPTGELDFQFAFPPELTPFLGQSFAFQLFTFDIPTLTARFSTVRTKVPIE